MGIRIKSQVNGTKMLMCKLKPLQVAMVTKGDEKGHIVMRTASTKHFEVLDLSNACADECWGGSPGIEVELLTTPITIEISND